MKKMCKTLAAIALVLVATVSANAQKDTFKVCYDKIDVKVVDLAPNADFKALNTCYQISVAPDAVEPCASLVITPVIKKGDQKKVLEIIVVNGYGKIGSQRWLEMQCYKACDPNQVRFFTLREGDILTVNTCKAVNFDEWMYEGAEFEITTQKMVYKPYNCLKDFPGAEKVCDVPYIKAPYYVFPIFQKLPFDAEFSAKRVVNTVLYYPVNGTAKVESYLENAAALKLLGSLNDDDLFIVSNINIKGWASPESSVPYNQNLSENRAKTMKKIIADKYNFADEVFSTVGMGEYWNYVTEFIDSSNDATIAANRSELQNALMNSDLDAREAAIKKVAGGKAYKIIFDNVYPRSRFAECVVSYEMKEFSYEAARIIFDNDPESLSADDYVAMINIQQEPEVVSKAVELYPNDDRFNLIAAEKAYFAGNYNTCLKRYEAAKKDSQVLNNMGCCYLNLGNTDMAKKYFMDAENNRAAEHNLWEVRKAVLNKKYFNK